MYYNVLQIKCITNQGNYYKLRHRCKNWVIVLTIGSFALFVNVFFRGVFVRRFEFGGSLNISEYTCSSEAQHESVIYFSNNTSLEGILAEIPGQIIFLCFSELFNTLTKNDTRKQEVNKIHLINSIKLISRHFRQKLVN